MTQEEKAKAYDEAKVRMSRAYNSNRCTIGFMNEIFPELAESEDERIRKSIIKFLIDVNNGAYTKPELEIASWITWLEKQGEQKVPVADFKAKDWYVSKVDGKIRNIYYPIDKVEPKFHEGEWVVSNLDGKARQISEVHFDEYNSYYVVEGESVNLEEYDRLHHLWTIADAKDGDVLAVEPIEGFPSSFIAIYKKQNEEDFDSYCFVGFDGKFYENEYGHSTEDIHPATKEQRNTLMKAMAAAGYTFDFENKELKKIEQKPAVEPKFKVGDWITFYGGESFKILKIEAEVNGILDYLLLNQNGHDSFYNKKYVDENARLWSIKDAKKGDILFQDLMDGKTFIFDGINPEMTILYSFIINNDGKDVLPYDIGKPNTGIGYVEDGNIIYPATKEQRDLLFQKMKESGYVWDAEKKEVKIIDCSKHIKYEPNGPSIIEEKPVN